MQQATPHNAYLFELIQLVLEQSNHSIIFAAFAHTVGLATELLHICPDGLQIEAYLTYCDNSQALLSKRYLMD